MLITIFPAKQKNSACGSEVERQLHTQRSRSCKVKRYGGMGRGFLLHAPQGAAKLDVSCETLCPNFFLQQLFLPPIRSQHSSGRYDSTWIDHVHPKTWCFSLGWWVFWCDGWLSICRGSWLGFTGLQEWPKMGRRIRSLLMSSQIKCHCIEIAIRPSEMLRQTVTHFNSSKKEKKKKSHINKSSVPSL